MLINEGINGIQEILHILLIDKRSQEHLSHFFDILISEQFSYVFVIEKLLQLSFCIRVKFFIFGNVNVKILFYQSIKGVPCRHEFITSTNEVSCLDWTHLF